MSDQEPKCDHVHAAGDPQFNCPNGHPVRGFSAANTDDMQPFATQLPRYCCWIEGGTVYDETQCVRIDPSKS